MGMPADASIDPNLPAPDHGSAAGAARDTALVLVNLGTPEAPTAPAVRRYLSEFLHDRRVVSLTRWLWCPLLHFAIVPLRWPARDATPAAPVASAPTTTAPVRVGATQPAPAPVTRPTQVDDGTRSPSNVAATPMGDAAAVASVATGPANDSSDGSTHSPDRSPRPPATTAAPTGTPDASRLAATSAPRQDTVEPSATPELERLYAESAQLEGLLALARDGGGSVANGAVSMLSDDLATRVARIDAALMQPSLGNERRIALWRERVDALRQAAAFESTQRLLAARGQQYDAMLVSID